MRSNLIFCIILTFAFIQACYGQNQNKLVLLQNPKSAKCLDGSAPGYYFSQGYGDGQNKFVLYMEGGFYCNGQTEQEILENCYQRSFTDLGSSSKWSQTYVDNGIFSPLQKNNPLFYNWNRVFIRYCDGTYYQSSRDPVVYKNQTLHFRGSDNFKEIIEDISNQYGLKNSSIVVLAGGSAGGQGSYFWSQYLRNYLPSTIKMVASPDCGFNVQLNPVLQDKNPVWVDFITDRKREIIQPQGCPYLHDDQNLYKCFLTEYIIDQINLPVFFISSLYDQFFINTYLQINCINSKNALVGCTDLELAKIENMRQKLYDAIAKIRTVKKDWGMWAVSCVLHVFSQRLSYNNQVYQVPEDSQITPSLALKSFIEAVEQNKPLDSFYFIDELAYPNNVRCNGLQNLNQQ
ncbi:hypothetical protein ABPG74_013223 [Tetrahymena malaccensis]